MFSTKEIKDVVHTFPIRGGDISNPIVADGLIPSESKDGFVQVQTLQEALKRAIEEGKERLSLSSFASTYDVKRNVVLELLEKPCSGIVWSRNRDEVLSRSEQRHLKQRLVDCSLDQFVDVDRFLLKNDIHKSSLVEIDEPSLLKETIDYDGKKYLHSTQLTEKVTMHIMGRLSKAEQDINLIKFTPGDLPGHPPLSLIFRIVDVLRVSGGEHVLEGSEVKFTPGSYKQVLLRMNLDRIRSGKKLYADASSISSNTSLQDISSGTIKVYGRYLVSSILLKQMSLSLKTQLLDTGYAHVPMSEGFQEISQGLHNIIVLNLTEVYEQSRFQYSYPYVFSHYWLDRMKEELMRVVDFLLQTRWDFAPPLDPLDDLPNALELRQNSLIFENMPIDLFNMLLSTDLRKIMKARHATKLKGLQEEADHTFNAFWLQQVSATIEVFVQALLKVEDEKLRNQLSVTLATFIRTTLVPKVIAKALKRRLVRRGDLAEELSELEKNLGLSTPPSTSTSSFFAIDSSTCNRFYRYLESSIVEIVQFSKKFSVQFNTPRLSYRSLFKLQHLMCFSSSSPSNSPSPSPLPSRPSAPTPAEPSVESGEIPSTFLEARKVALFEDLRHGMVDETDDARLFLKMLIILFARRHQVMIYSTGKAAPKLLKELFYFQRTSEEEDEKKKNNSGKKQQQAETDDSNDNNDAETKLIGGIANMDPMTGVESTAVEPDTSVDHSHRVKRMEKDPQANPPAKLETASSTQQQSSIKLSSQEEEKFISFTPPQHKYPIPVPCEKSNSLLYSGLGFDINSSEFRIRINDLKERVKAEKVTDDDRMYMRSLAGVVDEQSGEVLLNGHRNEKGKWIKYKRNGVTGGLREEEEEMEIKNWFRVRFERGADLL